ncbi:Chromodomain-helicase-DNA-binding 3 [Gossypium arboreum]|uniref:Chromodomain-helicase-DNA-binding 3 n=1 Tax=Gossypium arboreum TaxID=29729 RepID=A0A0B0NVY5_GOSAR|nr:Chromodomain-helicase-DNA-binding 3 [Gossypium arboreum]
MAYNFRNRNLLNTRGAYLGSSGSDSESQDDSDPDFLTPSRTPRRSTQNNTARAGGASSIRNLSGKRSRGNGEERRRGRRERHRRRRKRKFSQVPQAQISRRTVLSWLIGLGVIEENEVVWYVAAQSGNILGEGKVNREGILCSCCSGQLTVEEFEVHSGRKTRKPYQHIYLAGSQVSLLDCQIEAWEDKEEEETRKFNNIQPASKAVDRYDDACMICADGGDLICCERCPSTFHPRCIFMEDFDHCSLFTDHLRCGGEPLDLMNPPVVFCGSSCRKIYEGLHNLLGSQNALHDGLTWTLLQRIDEPFTGSYGEEEYKRIQCNSKIAVAWLVMNECFLSTIDRHTRTNIVQSIVYNRGSNVTRINYSGFYTAILEKNDEIISVASIRVHGKRLAEMPFIGTRGEYRRLGMAYVLENCIESTLCSLKVEKLVIPSVSQLTGMWMDKYFFSRVQEERLVKELSLYNTVMFPSSVVRLYKNLAMLPDLNLSPEEKEGHF